MADGKGATKKESIVLYLWRRNEITEGEKKGDK